MKDVLPTAPEVRQQLARILGSEEFGNATQLRRFPEYVVEEELGGRADKIRAHTIEMTVLGRDDSFDPQVDPVVRIQAGRLHRALERYYLGSGQPDPIRLHIPKGTYVPRFAVRGPAAEPTAGTDSSRSPSFFRRRAVRAARLAVMVAA